MRTFIACEPPNEMVDQTAALARQAHRQINGRFIGRENYHLTLAFLGDVSESQLAQATDALDRACAGIGPFTILPDQLGIFGPRRNATLWLGFAKCPEIERLAARLREELDCRQVAYDDKPFKAHLTLARHANMGHGQLKGLVFPDQSRIDTVTLFKSTLNPEGACYTPLHTCTLA